GGTALRGLTLLPLRLLALGLLAGEPLGLLPGDALGLLAGQALGLLALAAFLLLLLPTLLLLTEAVLLGGAGRGDRLLGGHPTRVERGRVLVQRPPLPRVGEEREGVVVAVEIGRASCRGRGLVVGVART